MGTHTRRGGTWAGLAVVAALACSPAHAEHHMGFAWSGDVGIIYDDNVGNAGDDGDIRDDTILSGGVSLDYTWRPSLFTGLLLRSSLRADGFADAEGLSNAKLVEVARLSHRSAGGFYAPTLAVWASVGLSEFASTMRDGVEYRGGAYVVEPITTAISARFGVSVTERDSDSVVFDLSSWSANLDFDWRVARTVTAYAGYQFLDGDIVSSGSQGGGGGSSAADPDDALPGLRAYRVKARTGVATLGFNLPLSAQIALDLQLRRAGSETDRGSTYDRWLGGVSLLVRF